MKAEIISIGTELLLGHTINTDAAYIANALANLGIDLHHIQMVGDNPERLKAALRLALERSDVVITSGGLGPTKDDLSKECAAAVAGLDLEINSQVLEYLKEYFGKRSISQNQLKQALFPKGAVIFKNPHGTAPGCAIPLENGKFICLLPGPPRELVPMLENELLPFLRPFSTQIIKSSILRTFGIGEGLAAEKLDSLVDLENPTVATYAADGEMFVKISAKAESEKEADLLLSPLIRKVEKILGGYIYGREVQNLEEVVVTLLRNKNLTLATAESCTGGLLAKRITDQPGASEIFHLGVITYANKAKEKILGVKPQTLQNYGAVSPQTAAEMAISIKNLAHADFGIGITGIAGPDGGTVEKPLGLVYVALAANEIHIAKLIPQGRYLGRAWVRQRASSLALDLLRRLLTDLPLLTEL